MIVTPPQVSSSARAAIQLMARRTKSTLAASVASQAVHHTAPITKKNFNQTWSQGFSFATPEADFVSTPQMRSNSTVAASGPSWSNSISYSSPESDFVGVRASSTLTYAAASESMQPSWSGSLSFASPDSDFVGARASSTLSNVASEPLQSSWSGSLSFASPESDFVGAAATFSTESVGVSYSSAHNRQEAWSNSLSFASPESDFTGGIGTKTHELPFLPRTMKEALSLYTDKALVITTATHPHLVVHVNKAWENLCGYEKQNVLHQPIGELLQGPKTNTSVAKSMTQQVLSSHLASAPKNVDAYLVNYKASGESFVNHITAGPLYIEEEDNQAHATPQFLVGILEEVNREDVPLRLAV